MSSVQTTPPRGDDEDEIDLSEIGRTIIRQRRKIALITIATTTIAVFYVLLSRPQFTVSGSIYLGSAQSGGGAATQALTSGLGFLSAFQSVSGVETQVELIRARSLLARAIEQSGLNAQITPVDAPNINYWRWKIYDGKAIDTFAPKPGGLQAKFATFAEPVSQSASFRVLIGKNGTYRIRQMPGWFLAGKTILTGRLGQPAAGGGLSLLLSPVIAKHPPKPGARFNLKVSPANLIVKNITTHGLFSVGAGGTVTQPTKLANLSLLWPNPYEGRLFINQVMNDFIETQISWKTQSASSMEDFISGQLDKIRSSLNSADQKLASYQSKTGIIDVPENAKAVIEELSKYEVQRTTLELQQEALKQLSDEMAAAKGSLNPYLVSESDDPVLGKLAGELALAQTKLDALRAGYTGKTSEIQTQQATIYKIQQSIRTLIVNDLSLAGDNLSNIDQLIEKFKTKIKTMPSESLNVIALARSSDVFGKLYVLLMEKDEEAEVSKAATVIDTRVVNSADLPLASTTPKAAVTVLIGLFIGLFGSVGLVLGQRAISGRFQSEDEIRRLVSLPIYGLVPKRASSEIAKSIFSLRPQSQFAEAFRLLRSNLYQSTSGQQSRVIAITSAVPGDGKTTTLTNLAKILADDGRRVILVDADLHRGRVHEALKIDQAPGLTEWLVNTVPSRFQPVPDQKFMALPSGVLPPNPSELLNEPMLEDIIAALRAEFDFIVLDCPPLPAVSDSVRLSKQSDLVLSVVNVEHTPRRSFTIHNETLDTLGVRRGIVINAASDGGQSYGYGSSYGYGYGEARDRVGPIGRVRAAIGRLISRGR